MSLPLDVLVLVSFNVKLLQLICMYYVLNYYHLGNFVPSDLCFGILHVWFGYLIYEKDFYLLWN